MDQYVEIRRIVEERAKLYGIGELSKQRTIIQEQLLQVEQYFQNLILKQIHVKKKAKELTKINVSTVSLGTNVQRSTIYNNPNTLQIYIDTRIEEIQKEDILGIHKSNKIKHKHDNLNILLEGLQQQVVDNFELILQIRNLETELKSMYSQKEDVQLEFFRLEQENSKLRRQLNSLTKDKISPLKKVNKTK